MKFLGLPSVGDINVPEQSDSIQALVLVANVAQPFTVPAGARHVLFSFSAPIWVKNGDTAAIPSASSAAGTSSELNPGIRRVAAGDVVSVIAAEACKGSLAFYF